MLIHYNRCLYIFIYSFRFFARIAVHRPQGGDLLVILVVEDNLVKGAAGQAVQAMNLMAGIDEKTGLYRPATTP